MTSSNQAFGDLLTYYEAEKYIEALQVIPINEYASPKWLKQHELLNKLNMQAHVNAMMRADEFVMESLSSLDKMKMLIYDLIVTEIWKEKVLPYLKDHLANMRSYRPYLAIYHEAVILNLLEVSLFHRTAIEASENFILELIDYAYRKLSNLLQKPRPKVKENLKVEDLQKRTRLDEYQGQIDDIEFSLSMMSMSIIRFITDHVKHLSVGVIHHLLVETDILFLIVPLIEEKPWLRTNAKGEREVFDNQKWNFVPKEEYYKLPKLEANAWIIVYNLFMDAECRKKYEINEHRKNNLLRLKKFMNEVLVDQIPNLADMIRSLEELSLMAVGTQLQSTSLIVQQIPEIRNEVCNGKNWKELAEYQKQNYLREDEKSLAEDLERMASLYDYNILEGLMEGFKCPNCKKEAIKRCSKCKAEYYCSRECQVAHWKDHKPICMARVAELDKKNTEQKENAPVTQKEKSLVTEVVKETKTEKPANLNNPLNELD